MSPPPPPIPPTGKWGGLQENNTHAFDYVYIARHQEQSKNYQGNSVARDLPPTDSEANTTKF